jgi:hypothetical protein
VRPPTRSRASSTQTDAPPFSNSRAAVSPASPAPTTTTSTCRSGSVGGRSVPSATSLPVATSAAADVIRRRKSRRSTLMVQARLRSMVSPCVRAFAFNTHRAVAPSSISILGQCGPSIHQGGPHAHFAGRSAARLQRSAQSPARRTLSAFECGDGRSGRGGTLGSNAPARTRTRNSSLEARHDHPFHHRGAES